MGLFAKKKKPPAPQNAISDAQLAQGAAALEGVVPPTVEELTAKLQRAVYLGDISAIEAAVILQRDTEMRGIRIDPALEMQQFHALEQLSNMGTASGMGPQDKAALFETGRQVQQRQKAGRMDISQRAQERGLGGSGLEQQAQAEALQEPYGADLSGRLGLTRDAGMKRMGAQVDAGNYAGGLRSQGFGEDVSVATAQDIINKFNTEATNTGRMANVEDARAVALRNIMEKQRISNINTDIANEEETGRAGAFQQDFENRLGKATAISDLYTQGGLNAARNARAPIDRENTIGPALAGAGAQLLSEYGPRAWDEWSARLKRKEHEYGKNRIG